LQCYDLTGFQDKRKTSRALVAFLIILGGFLSPAGLLGLAPVHGVNFISVTITYAPIGPKINDTVSITGTWAGGSGTYNFTWGFGDGSPNATVTATNPLTGTSDTRQHQYSKAGSYLVGLTICDVGCLSRGKTAISLPIRGSLTTSFSISPSTIYFGDPVTLSGTVSNGTRTLHGTYNYTFNWDFGDGGKASQQVVTASLPATSTVTHNLRASTQVSISLMVNDSFGQTGSATQTINVGGLLGIDCGYGSNEAAANVTGTPVPDGADSTGNALKPTLDASCTWAGSPDIPSGGTQLQPLVSDNPTISPGFQGGGFTAEVVYVQGASSSLLAFDLIISWDPKILNAVEFDEGGLPFSTNSFTPVSIIDNSAGTAELSQATLGTSISGNVTLFRIRFDVVGVGTTSLSISQELLKNPNITGSLPHRTIQGSFISSNIPDLIWSQGHPPVTLGYSVSWTYSPNPLKPGSPMTLTATATCGQCTGTLTYEWDVDSVQGYPDPSAPPPTVEVSGNPASITVPTATLLGHRVTLIVNDTAGHVAEATRRLPLTVTIASPGSLQVGALGSFSAEWLGGIPPYTGTNTQVGVKWSLCNGTGTTQTICTNPNPVFASQPGQINTVSNTYMWAGVFTGTVSVTDTAEPQIPSGPTTAGASFQVNVTGTPQAFTVALATNATSGSVARNNVMVNASVAYNAGYYGPARSRSFTYTFIFGDGNTTIIQNKGLAISIYHNFTSAGTYSITVTAQETASNSLAKIEETGFSQVAVLNPVAGTFQINPSAIVSGQSISFTATGSGGQPPYTYSWDFGDGSTGTGASATHTYASSGTYTVKLTVTDSQGRTFTSTQTVVVNTSATFYIELGAGIAVAAAAAIAGLLFLRKRKKNRISPGVPSPTVPSTK
jgi:PKD repeat protein